MYRLAYQLDDFSAAHRLVKGYQGPCAHLHGHNYRVGIEIEAKTLQDYDMLIDFSEIKAVCNAWVQNHLDHGTLVCSLDTELVEFLRTNNQKHFVFPDEENTTAECLSRVIFEELSREIKKHPLFCATRLISVRVHESARASAIYRAS